MKTINKKTTAQYCNQQPITWLLVTAALVFLSGWLLPAISEAITLPTLQIGVTETEDPQQIATVIEILLLFTVLSMAPAILLTMTCFPRLVIVFAFLRSALGTQQTPPRQILIGLALFLTLFIMFPVFTEIDKIAIQPYMAEEINFKQALDKAAQPMRTFMFAHTREKDLALFLSLTNTPKPQSKAEVPLMTLVPAFMISELKTAFTIGFVLFLPFLIIDMVVASVLLAMGMMMLPPIMVSLPFKLLLFVLVDGWYLLVGSLVKSFGV